MIERTNDPTLTSDISFHAHIGRAPERAKTNKTNTIIRSQLIQRFAFFHPPELYDHLKRFGRRPTSTLIIIIH